MVATFVLLYVSTAAPDVHVGSITRPARHRNAQRGIAGVLAYDGDSFVQILEGPEPALSALLAKLRLDPRHQDLEVLAFEPARGPRRYASWDLGYHFIEEESDALAGLRGHRGEAALQAFEALAGKLDVVSGKGPSC